MPLRERTPPVFDVALYEVRVNRDGLVVLRVATESGICMDFRFPRSGVALNAGHDLEKAYMLTVSVADAVAGSQAIAMRKEGNGNGAH